MQEKRIWNFRLQSGWHFFRPQYSGNNNDKNSDGKKAFISLASLLTFPA